MTPERWQQIKQLYESAVKRDESERAAFVEEACAGDPELRREVESLLAYQDREDAFIETPALEVAARGLAEERPSLLGRSLGSFHHLVPYAAGGGATVENLELRCKVHNSFEAERYYGSSNPV